MIFNIIYLATLVVAFFMCIKAYTLGLKHGKQIINNEVPEINPVKAMSRANKKEEEQMDKITQGLENILSYNGEDQTKKVSK